MPPKPATSTDSETANSVMILCQLMSTCTEFKADTAALAPVLGIAQAKNVPRKINSIIGQHGFELRGGKIVNKDDGSMPPATPGSGKSKKTPDGKKTPSTPSKVSKKIETPKTPASKKRKIENEDASDDAGVVKNESRDGEDMDQLSCSEDES